MVPRLLKLPERRMNRENNLITSVKRNSRSLGDRKLILPFTQIPIDLRTKTVHSIFSNKNSLIRFDVDLMNSFYRIVTILSALTMKTSSTQYKENIVYFENFINDHPKTKYQTWILIRKFSNFSFIFVTVPN